MLATMPDLSKWSVKVHRWVWIYTFASTGVVERSDPVTGRTVTDGTGYGTWKIENTKAGQKLVTRFEFKTYEYWDLPIDPSNATGTAHMAEGVFHMKAKALNIYILTEEAKANFLSGCQLASSHIQTAGYLATAWINRVGIVYGDAVVDHNNWVRSVTIDKTKHMITAFEVTATFAGMFLGGGVGGVVGAMAGNAYKTLEYGQMTAAFLVDGLKDMAKHAVRAPLGSLAGGALTVSAPKGPMNPETWLKAHVAKINDELATASATVSYWIGAVKADDFTFDAGFDPATLTKSSLNIDGHSLFALPSFEDLDVKNGFLRGFLADFCDHLPKVRPAQAQEAERITQQPIRDRAAQIKMTDIDGHLHWKYSVIPSDWN